MCGSDELREDASGMIEMARLLELGFASELESGVIELGQERRRELLAIGDRGFSVWGAVGKVAVGFASLAACVVFAALAPVAWNQAIRSNSGYSGDGTASVENGGGADLPTAVIVGSLPDSESIPPVAPLAEDSTGSISVPNVTVGFVEMPVTPLGVELQ